MRIAPIKNYIIASGVLTVMAAWVPISLAATADERAKCEEMAKQMGTEQRHEHKSPGPGTMNITHARCKEILAEPVENTGKEEGRATRDH